MVGGRAGSRFRTAGVLLVAATVPAVASAQAPFTEEAAERGLDFFTPAIPGISHGFGLAFGDLDGDGDPDVVTTAGLYGEVGVFENDGSGHFTAHTTTSGIPFPDMPSAVLLFDYDGDADLDVYLPQYGGPTGNILARNLGGFRFERVESAGIHDLGNSTGSAAADYDGDGWLDLLVPSYGTADRLYRNLGDGTFEEVAGELGLDDPWRGLQATFFDMDGDGDADVYMSNDKKDSQETEMHNRLYENRGGTFTDVSAGSGADVNIFSMGVACGDFDRNGLPDLYCTNLEFEPNALLLCSGPGTYMQTEVTAGVASNRTGWGAAFFDYDNNTHQDLYVCNRFYPPALANNRLYVHDGVWPARDVAPLLEVDDDGESFALALGDVDGDGDVDLLVQNLDGPTRLYINHEGERRNWFKFRVGGPAPNHFAVGARVSIRSDGIWQHVQVLAGGNGYLGQNDLAVHFGLDSAEEIEGGLVRWPDGTRRSFGRLASNRTYAIDQSSLRPVDPPSGSVERTVR